MTCNECKQEKDHKMDCSQRLKRKKSISERIGDVADDILDIITDIID